METKQIVTPSFVVLMEEIQKAILMGYRIQFGEHTSPYHQLMGNYIVNLEMGPFIEMGNFEEIVDSEKEVVENAPTKQRGRKAGATK